MKLPFTFDYLLELSDNDFLKTQITVDSIEPLKWKIATPEAGIFVMRQMDKIREEVKWQIMLR